VRFADVVATPTVGAVGYLGMAIGLDIDRYGKKPASDELLMNQFVTAGKLTASSKKFGLALYSDDGTGSVASTTKSFMDFGDVTVSPVTKTGTKAAEI